METFPGSLVAEVPPGKALLCLAKVSLAATPALRCLECLLQSQQKSPQLFPALEPRWNPRGPEREKDTPRRGKYSPGSSPGLKDLLKKMEKAARGGYT
ncbi:hypothetical protein CIB84_016962 [Bambusicola thoracicus]|uniref:Uncharacterized protein n=1 Tax=Bambusicola thoracicus TaxID=9083 RepID=A0A2P4S5C0_BAMTH|nr:hypothetical protein CIB84_016962 [Bambusicola thoracicus]